MTSVTNAKKKQDEKNVRCLRELVSLASNKHCFDCGQRGPTYVNMTIGSFVCTACSGSLRGLNPPHRVKSISMASFSAEEVDFIRARGNEECRKVWLGLADDTLMHSTANSPFKDDHQIKDHLIKKYERKRWYVSPTDISQQQRLLEQRATVKELSSASSSSSSGVSSQRSPSSSIPSLPPPSFVPDVPSIPKTCQQSVDLLSQDPFGSPLPAAPNLPPTETNNFANFAQFNAPAAQPFPNSSAAAHSDDFNAAVSRGVPKSATFATAGMAPLEPVSASGGGGGQPQSEEHKMMARKEQEKTAAVGVSACSDKYSALAELDGLFHTSNGSSGVPGVPTLASAGPKNLGWAAPTTTTSSIQSGQPMPIFGGQSLGVTKSTTMDSFAGSVNQASQRSFVQPGGMGQNAATQQQNNLFQSAVGQQGNVYQQLQQGQYQTMRPSLISQQYYQRANFVGPNPPTATWPLAPQPASAHNNPFLTNAHQQENNAAMGAVGGVQHNWNPFWN